MALPGSNTMGIAMVDLVTWGKERLTYSAEPVSVGLENEATQETEL